MYIVRSAMFRARQFSNRKVAVENNMSNKLVKKGIVGAVITAICCFTPVLVVLFGALGLAALVGYLDFVLFPLLGVFLVLLVIGLIKGKRCAA